MASRTELPAAAEPAIAPLPYRPRAVEVEARSDGSYLLRSPYPPRNTPRSIAHLFIDRATLHPDRAFVLERDADGRWAGLSYGEMHARARGIGTWLLERNLAGSGGVMILSGNSVDHAAVMLGCYLAGVPSVALSQAYSTGATDFAKLRHCFAKVRPRVVFVQSAPPFAGALDVLRAIDPAVVFVSADGGEGTVPLAELAATAATGTIDAATAALTHDTIAKYLFTSGSTGTPKGVPQTHGMMAAMVAARDGLLADGEVPSPPTSVDWMPWSHLSAGNIGFNNNIWAGGTLYLDEGRPAPGAFAKTLRNLMDVRPHVFGSAPIAFEMLVSALEADRSAAAALLPGLRWMSYGGAALSQDIADRVQRLALEVTGRAIPIITTYGSSEVQGITTVSWPTSRVGMIGLPLPGVELKLAPVGDKLEVRARGACVMPGYLDEPEKTAAAFDEEGFYCLGDAARFVDPDDVCQGIVFDGRISEDFKLTSGTWVSVGTLRTSVLAAASPHLSDLVITGQDRPFVGAIAWCAGGAGGSAVASRLRERLAAFNAGQGGSSRRIARLLIVDEPPSITAGEITEKGYINQRAVLERRAADVARLYAAEPDGEIILVDR